MDPLLHEEQLGTAKRVATWYLESMTQSSVIYRAAKLEAVDSEEGSHRAGVHDSTLKGTHGSHRVSRCMTKPQLLYTGQPQGTLIHSAFRNTWSSMRLG